MDDPLVRTADAIYSDRINLWRDMRDAEKEIDGVDSTDREKLERLVQGSIRMELCFDELRSFNNSGAFLGKHPFIKEKDERGRIADLLRKDPDSWFDERKNVELNITRYSSWVKSSKKSADEKARAAESLERYKALLQIYKDVFADFMGTRK